MDYPFDLDSIDFITDVLQLYTIHSILARILMRNNLKMAIRRIFLCNVNLVERVDGGGPPPPLRAEITLFPPSIRGLSLHLKDFVSLALKAKQIECGV